MGVGKADEGKSSAYELARVPISVTDYVGFEMRAFIPRAESALHITVASRSAFSPFQGEPTQSGSRYPTSAIIRT